jgi:hypothetical protein
MTIPQSPEMELVAIDRLQGDGANPRRIGDVEHQGLTCR